MPNWLIYEEVDLQRGAAPMKIWPNALVMYGDNQAHLWQVRVTDGGAAANLAGATVMGHFVREDGVTVPVAGPSPETW